MLQHGRVVRLILARSDVGDGQSILILDRVVQGDARVRLRQILSAGPDRDHVIILLDQICDLPTPSAGHDAGRSEGQPDVEYFQMIATGETARGIVPERTRATLAKLLYPVIVSNVGTVRPVHSNDTAHV